MQAGEIGDQRRTDFGTAAAAIFEQKRHEIAGGLVVGTIAYGPALALGGDQPGAVRWYLMERTGGKSFLQPSLHPDETHPGWLDATGPIIASDRMYIGFQDAKSGWQIAVFEQAAPLSRIVPVLDRLAVERQFARLRLDLPLQTIVQERAIRGDVLELPMKGSSAD